MCTQYLLSCVCSLLDRFSVYSIICFMSAYGTALFYAYGGRKAANLCQLWLPIKASVWACRNLLICLGSDDYFVREESLTISFHKES